MTDKEFKYHIPVRHDHGEIMEWLVDNNVPVDSRALAAGRGTHELRRIRIYLHVR